MISTNYIFNEIDIKKIAKKIIDIPKNSIKSINKKIDKTEKFYDKYNLDDLTTTT